MSHKTLISGTSYEITGGTALVDGTAYSIKSGKTLVDGTAYEVAFSKPVTVIVTGTGLASFVYIYHEEGGQTYTSPATFIANEGDTIACRIIECWSSQAVYLNGDYVDGGSGENDIYYDYIVGDNARIELYHNYASAKRSRVGKITITESSNGFISFTLEDSYYGTFSCTAVDGMTWAEWYNSELCNCASYMSISGDSVTFTGAAIKYNGTAVKSTDAIISGATYTV